MNNDTPMHFDTMVAWQNQRLFWFTCALLLMLGLSVGDNIVYHLQPLPVPYVLEVNGQGQPVGQVLPIRSVQAIPDALLKARLSDFIHDAFTIDQDPDEESYLFNRTRNLVTGQAAQKLDEWYNRDGGKHHPKLTSRYAWAETSINDTMKLAQPASYQVDYAVRNYSTSSSTPAVEHYRAVMHVIVGHSRNPEALGLFIDNLDIEGERP